MIGTFDTEGAEPARVAGLMAADGADARREDVSTSGPTVCHGVHGASSTERLPAGTALTERTRAFENVPER